jgi:hypothetical protein
MGYIVLKAKGIGGRLSEKGRVKAVFADGTEYSIDVVRIKGIYYYFRDRMLYIVYETENPGFYAKYAVPSVPQLATPLRFTIEEREYEKCKKCGHPMEFDDDEGYYCPMCGSKEYEDVHERVLKLRGDLKEEVREFAERLLGVPCKLEAMLYRGMAGGYTPEFDMHDVNDVPLFSCIVRGAALVENPTFVESHYDEDVTVRHRLDGKFLVLRCFVGGDSLYAVLRVEGEPRLDLLNELIKEGEERRRREQEERRKFLEEWSKKREEEKKRWGDPKAVISEILSKLPSWADGVYIKEVVSRDGDTTILIMPVKKSQYGGYYTSESWREIRVNIPEEYLKPLVNNIIIREEKKTVKVKEKKGGKYISLASA